MSSTTPSLALVTLVCILAPIILLFGAPFELWYEPKTSSVVFFVFGVFFLIGGIYVGEILGRTIRRSVGRRQNSFVSLDFNRKVYWAAFWLGGCGIMLRFLDWFVLRGVDLSVRMTQNVDLLRTSESNIFGFFAGMLLPFSCIPVLIAIREGVRLKEKWIWIGVISAIIYPLVSFGVADRSSSVVVVTLIAMRSFSVWGYRLFRHWWILFVIFVVLAIGWALVHVIRMEQRDVAPSFLLYESVYTYFVPISSSVLSSIRPAGSFLESFSSLLRFSGLHMLQYATHPILEVLYLIESRTANPHYGLFTFGLLAKSVLFLGIDYDWRAIFLSVPRPGIYTTFFGPLVMDFSYFAPFIGFVFGLASGIAWRLQQILVFRPISAFLAAFCVLSPFVNLFQWGAGSYYFVMFIVWGSTVFAVGGNKKKIFSNTWTHESRRT